MIRNLEKITESLTGKYAPAWLDEQRTAGLSRFNALGIPTIKDEEWKYTSLLPLSKHSFNIVREDKCAEAEDLKNYCDDTRINIVLINYIFLGSNFKL